MNTYISMDRQPTLSNLRNEIREGIAIGKDNFLKLVRSFNNRHRPVQEVETPIRSGEEESALQGLVKAVKETQLHAMRNSYQFEDAAPKSIGIKAAEANHERDRKPKNPKDFNDASRRLFQGVPPKK